MDSKRHPSNACTCSNSMIASSCASICEFRSMPPVQQLYSVEELVTELPPANNASNSVVAQPLSSCRKRPAASNNSTALDMPGCLRLHAYLLDWLLVVRVKSVGLDTTLTQAKRLSQNGHGSTNQNYHRRPNAWALIWTVFPFVAVSVVRDSGLCDEAWTRFFGEPDVPLKLSLVISLSCFSVADPRCAHCTRVTVSCAHMIAWRVASGQKPGPNWLRFGSFDFLAK